MFQYFCLNGLEEKLNWLSVADETVCSESATLIVSAESMNLISDRLATAAEVLKHNGWTHYLTQVFVRTRYRTDS